MQEKIKNLADINHLESERGFATFFKNFPLEQFHIVSVNPGATRGNHSHEYDEILCVIGGDNLAEITLENSTPAKQFIVKKEHQVIQINAGEKHTVKNIGDKTFYLVCFSNLINSITKYK